MFPTLLSREVGSVNLDVKPINSLDRVLPVLTQHIRVSPEYESRKGRFQGFLLGGGPPELFLPRLKNGPDLKICFLNGYQRYSKPCPTKGSGVKESEKRISVCVTF